MHFQAGYYTRVGRILLVRSFNECMSFLPLDGSVGVTRCEHKEAGKFKPISLEVAEATGLIETELYTRQVSYYPLIKKLYDEPHLGLMLLDPSYARPGITFRAKHDYSFWLKRLYVYVSAKDTVGLSIRAKFSYFSVEDDEMKSVDTNSTVSVPRTLIDNFDLKVYRAWVKSELATKQKGLEEHVNDRIKQLQAIIDPKYKV